MADLPPLLKDADLVVAHSLASCAFEAADIGGVPVVGLQLFPQLEEALFDKWTDLAVTAGWCQGGRRWQLVLRELLAARTSSLSGRSLWQWWAREPQVRLFEASLLERYLPKNEDDRCVGYPLWSGDGGPAPELLDFVQSARGGLLLLCQGTVLGRHRRWLSFLVIEACKRLNMKVVVLGDDPRVYPDEKWSAKNLRVVPFCPIRALLPHADVVVHHAGAGTLRHTLHAGLPTIAVPGPFDTIWNALTVIGARPYVRVLHPRTAREIGSIGLSILVGDICGRLNPMTPEAPSSAQIVAAVEARLPR